MGKCYTSHILSEFAPKKSPDLNRTGLFLKLLRWRLFVLLVPLVLWWSGGLFKFLFLFFFLVPLHGVVFFDFLVNRSTSIDIGSVFLEFLVF